jgi:peptide/nickel transport system substrate-binding protein
VVLHNLTAAFRELQFTIQAGSNKPWANKYVRQAINKAINRQNLIDKVYAGYGQYSAQVAAGYGPWQIPTAQLKANYEKYDLPAAKALMVKGGSKGFDVTMTTFSTPADYPAMAALIKNDLAQIGINANIVPQDPVTSLPTTAPARSTGISPVADAQRRRGYVAEYNERPIYSKWFTG